MKKVLLSVCVMLLFASFAAANSVTINGVNLSGFDSSQSVQFNLAGTSTSEGIGTLYLSQDTSGNVYFALVQPITLNNNAYGTTAASFGWPANGHKLSDLTGSDQAEFEFYDTTGKLVFDFDFDYLSQSGTAYKTLGDAGGDGGLVSTNGAPKTQQASWLLQAGTSASYDLTTYPSYTTNSPVAGDTKAPNWENRIIYEGEISASAFGSSGFGSLEVPLVHDSPAEGTRDIKFSTCTTGCAPVNTSAPEPSSLALLGTGLFLLGGQALRSRRARRM